MAGRIRAVFFGGWKGRSMLRLRPWTCVSIFRSSVIKKLSPLADVAETQRSESSGRLERSYKDFSRHKKIHLTKMFTESKRIPKQQSVDLRVCQNRHSHISQFSQGSRLRSRASPLCGPPSARWASGCRSRRWPSCFSQPEWTSWCWACARSSWSRTSGWNRNRRCGGHQLPSPSKRKLDFQPEEDVIRFPQRFTC